MTIACGLGLAAALAIGQANKASAADQAQFDAIESAMDSAIAAFTAASADLGSKSQSFVDAFNQAKTNVQAAAEANAQANKKKASSQLKKAYKRVNGVSFKLRNLHARKTIPSETRTMLLDLVNPIKSDLQSLRKDL
jgi:hypothetical protein